jgi:hypothetical protein
MDVCYEQSYRMQRTGLLGILFDDSLQLAVYYTFMTLFNTPGAARLPRLAFAPDFVFFAFIALEVNIDVPEIAESHGKLTGSALGQLGDLLICLVLHTHALL